MYKSKTHPIYLRKTLHIPWKYLHYQVSFSNQKIRKPIYSRSIPLEPPRDLHSPEGIEIYIVLDWLIENKSISMSSRLISSADPGQYLNNFRFMFTFSTDWGDLCDPSILLNDFLAGAYSDLLSGLSRRRGIIKIHLRLEDS